MDADDQLEINFSIPQGQLTWQSNYVGFSAWAPWTQAASGAAGRANVGFCSASTLCPNKNVHILLFFEYFSQKSANFYNVWRTHVVGSLTVSAIFAFLKFHLS